MNEIMDKGLFYFWQEAMEDCGHVLLIKDGPSCHEGIATAKRSQLQKIVGMVLGMGTWPSNFLQLYPFEMYPESI